jgi:DNA-binding XRE family transcriptional regulator
MPAATRDTDIVREFRKALGFTQARAAEWYGVDERTWRRWERKRPPKHLLKRIITHRVFRQYYYTEHGLFLTANADNLSAS